MKKTLLILMTFLMPLCVFTANLYSYKLIKLNDEAGKYVYPNATGLYGYKIQLGTNPSGFNKGLFEVTLENGKFSDGTSIRKNVPENEIFTVTWNDIANLGNIYGVVKISAAKPTITGDILKAENVIQFSHQIASLKGQTPTLVVTGSSNPPMGSKAQLTAQVLGDVIYPGIGVDNGLGGITNKIANVFEWSLTNWKTTSGKTGTFRTDPGVKQIVVQTDYFTQGSIKVRAVNDIGSAYSEIASQNFDRGFSFSNYPSSQIPFGQTATYTFAVTPVSGVTFEWEVPSGWQINGQGNVLEGVNLNSINVTTSSFCSNSSVVRVRLKKDAEVSGWFTCVYPGVSQPIITSATSPVYQYEDASFSISNISASAISSIIWSGDGVVTTSSQGVGAKLVFTKSGTMSLTANVLMKGCSAPVSISKQIVITPSRLMVSGPSKICSQASYTIDNLTSLATVTWSHSSNLNEVSGQGTSQYTVSLPSAANNGESWIKVVASVNNIPIVLPQLQFWAGVPRINSIQGPTVVCYTEENGYSANIDGEPTYYNWQIPGIARAADDNYNSEIVRVIWDQYIESYYFTLNVYNECGMAEKNIPITMPASCMGYYDSYFSLSPNPATTSVALTINDIQDTNRSTSASLQSKPSASKLKTASDNYTIKVTNSFGLQVYAARKSGKAFSIPVNNLRNGIYIVEVTNGNESYRKQLIIRR